MDCPGCEKFDTIKSFAMGSPGFPVSDSEVLKQCLSELLCQVPVGMALQNFFPCQSPDPFSLGVISKHLRDDAVQIF